MASNLTQKYWNGSAWVDLHPITAIGNVIDTTDGTTLAEKLNLSDQRFIEKSLQLVWTDGRYYSYLTGVVASSLTASLARLIPLNGQTSIRIQNAGNYVFFDESKTFLSGVNLASIPDTTVAVPALARYLGITSTPALKNTVILTFTPDTFITYDINETVVNIPNEMFIPPTGIEWMSGYYYSYLTGVLATSATSAVSGLIALNGQSTVTMEKGGNISFYDADKVFISGYDIAGVSKARFDIPLHAAYVGMSVSTSNLLTVKVIFDPDSTNKNILNEENVNISSYRQDTIHAHSKDFIRVPTVSTDGTANLWATHQATHPSVIQFSTTWNGYKYWMAYTPYPNGVDTHENPCIAASNDGLKWNTVVTNPLTAIDVGHMHNSDVHLLYRADLNQLEVWYRPVKTSKTGELINRIVISSSLNVGAHETIFETTVGQNGIADVLQYISPSVVYDNSKYKVWIMRDWFITYMESADLVTWSTPVRIKAVDKDIPTWHPSITKVGSFYHLFNLYNNNTLGNGGDILYSTSKDGINFTAEIPILKYAADPFRLDGRGIYRATPIWFGNGSVGVYYGMISLQYVWTIGLMVGKDFKNLIGIERHNLENNNAL